MATPKKQQQPAGHRPSSNPAHPLVRWRTRAGMSQAQFLSRLRRYLPPEARTMTVSTLCRYETQSIQRPTPSILRAISRATDGEVSVADLMAG